MKKYTSVLIGCGDIGSSLASLLNAHHCVGVRRSPEKLPHSLEGIAADFTDPDSLANALGGQSFDYAVLTLTPGAFNEAAYRNSYLAGVRACIEVLQIRRKVFFVSSSSVYGENSGGWVDEDSALEATGFSGRIMAEAEQALWDSRLATCSVRFSGIYGPGRQRLVRRVQAGEFSRQLSYSNRIHRDDCAAVLAHLITLDANDVALQDCYLASDNLPVLNTEVEQWLSQQLELPPPPALSSMPAVGKRCNNQRLRDSGFKFIHNDFRSGYTAMLTAQE